MLIETERLILRPWEEADAEECYRYAKDPNVGPMAGWQPHTDVENSRQVIREVLMVPETYAIVLKETGLPVGSIGLHRNDLASKEDEAELGYWIGAPYWGRGLVPEAARALLRHAFEDLGLARIWCGHYDGNEKSKRVQEKLGFRYQWTSENVPVPQMGETRKGHVNLMTKEEWGKLYGKDRKFFMKSERAGFSKWSSSDLPLAWQLWGNARVTRYISADGRFTNEQIAERLKKEIQNDVLYGVQYWPVFDLEKGGLIGCCGLRPHGEAEYEIGCHLLLGYRGKGYAAETAQAVLDYAFQTLHADKLFAGHHPDNEASRRVLEKLGFSGIGSEYYAPTGRMHPSYEFKNPGVLEKAGEGR